MKYLYVLLLIVFIASCRCSNEPKDQANIPVDTLMVGAKKILLYPITKSDFEAVKYDGTKDYDSIPFDPERILATEDTLRISCDNGEIVTFLRDTNDGEGLSSYAYAGTLKSCKSVSVAGYFWEWLCYYLVSVTDGHKTQLLYMPNVSPSGNFIVCSFADLEAQFVTNGIELYKVNNGSVREVFKVEIADWGPEEIRWQSDSVIFIKRLHLDKKYKESYDYVKANLVVRKYIL